MKLVNSDFTHKLQPPIFHMTPLTASDPGEWERIFIEAGISAASAKFYAQTFESKKLTKDSLLMLDHSMLQELGIKTMGEMLAILNLIKELPPHQHCLPTTQKHWLQNFLKSTWKWQNNSKSSK